MKKTMKYNAKPRNFTVLNPLLHKGGAHEKTKKVQRQQQKQALRKQLRSADLAA